MIGDRYHVADEQVICLRCHTGFRRVDIVFVQWGFEEFFYSRCIEINEGCRCLLRRARRRLGSGG